jgi:hypothetical protein
MIHRNYTAKVKAAQLNNGDKNTDSSFSQQYKHPLWQKKRLEMLEAADYACQSCFDNETLLHVHHKQYFAGRKVWEYDANELLVLCENCHKDVHAETATIKSIIASISPDGYKAVIGLLSGFCWAAGEPYPDQWIEESIKKGISKRAIQVGGIAGQLMSCSEEEIIQIAKSIGLVGGASNE